jgi:hypothetical protein
MHIAGVYVTKWVLLCVRPRRVMYNKLAGFDAGSALAGLISAVALRILGTDPNPGSDW